MVFFRTIIEPKLPFGKEIFRKKIIEQYLLTYLLIWYSIPFWFLDNDISIMICFNILILRNDNIKDYQERFKIHNESKHFLAAHTRFLVWLLNFLGWNFFCAWTRFIIRGRGVVTDRTRPKSECRTSVNHVQYLIFHTYHDLNPFHPILTPDHWQWKKRWE